MTGTEPLAEIRTANETDVSALARYQLLAAAIARRPLGVAWAEGGEPTFTDGRAIFVSRSAHDSAIRAHVAVQAALLGAGSLAPEHAPRLRGRPALARRYLVLEATRAFTALGDPPGLRGVVTVDAPVTATPEESLEIALSRTRLGEPPQHYGVLRPRRLMRDEAGAGGGAPTPDDLRRPPRPAPIPEADEDDETEDPGRIARLFQSPLGARGPLTAFLARLLGFGREAGTGPGGAELPTGSARHMHGAGRGVTVAHTDLPHGESPPSFGPSIACYPEWDERHRRYLPDHCTVVALESDIGIESVPPESYGWLRRALHGLGLELEPTRRQPEGDDLDLDALVELSVDVAIGATPHEAVYVQPQRRRRDLGVLILLDISGSTAERGSHGISVHDHQLRAASALIDTFSALGDRVGAYAFHSRGRGAVHVARVKGFNDPFDVSTRQRLAALRPSAFTRLGAATRHATQLLLRDAGTPWRLLVVLSDGFAYDHGYEGTHGEADARRALLEARSAGVGCVCLSIGADRSSEALARVFGTAAHASAPRLDALRGELGRLFRSALHTAERRRRFVARRAVRSQVKVARSRRSRQSALRPFSAHAAARGPARR